MVAHPSTNCQWEPIKQMMDQIQQWVDQAAQQGAPAHRVELHLFRQLMQMGHQILGLFFQQQGDGDLGETFPLPDGDIVQRLEDLHRRRYVSVFGEFHLDRVVYGSREKQAIEFIPFDQRLQLPESPFSYVLQEWDQLLGVEQAYGRVAETMETILGIKQSVSSLEHMNQQMAKAVEPFREALPAPPPDEEGALIVATVDNKGIPMVRPTEAAPVGAHRSKGQKANKKQMATIGCVYTVDRHVRTADELVAILFRDEDRPDTHPPEPRHRRYWASLSREVADESIRGQDEVFACMAAELETRRSARQRLVFLTDGQESLETDRDAHLPVDGFTTSVLDLMHVLPRLWEAAHLFCEEGSEEAEAFVRDRLHRVLSGRAAGVIGGFRQMGTKWHLRGTKKQRLARICCFLTKNLSRMAYDVYLRRGYPIATGVIEGACRHVIKDRMERSGMRWKVAGAWSMLQLRTVYANDHWSEFQAFRIEHETNRLYPHQTALDRVEWPMAA